MGVQWVFQGNLHLSDILLETKKRKIIHQVCSYQCPHLQDVIRALASCHSAVVFLQILHRRDGESLQRGMVTAAVMLIALVFNCCRWWLCRGRLV